MEEPVQPTHKTQTANTPPPSCSVIKPLFYALGIIFFLGSLAAAGVLYPTIGYSALGVVGGGIFLLVFFLAIATCCSRKTQEAPPEIHDAKTIKEWLDEKNIEKLKELTPDEVRRIDIQNVKEFDLLFPRGEKNNKSGWFDLEINPEVELSDARFAALSGDQIFVYIKQTFLHNSHYYHITANHLEQSLDLALFAGNRTLAKRFLFMRDKEAKELIIEKQDKKYTQQQIQEYIDTKDRITLDEFLPKNIANFKIKNAEEFYLLYPLSPKDTNAEPSPSSIVDEDEYYITRDRFELLTAKQIEEFLAANYLCPYHYSLLTAQQIAESDILIDNIANDDRLSNFALYDEDSNLKLDLVQELEQRNPEGFKKLEHRLYLGTENNQLGDTTSST